MLYASDDERSDSMIRGNISSGSALDAEPLAERDLATGAYAPALRRRRSERSER